MKVSKASKTRAAGRRDQVKRYVVLFEKEYRGLFSHDGDPTQRYELIDCSYWEPVYPPSAGKLPNNPAREKLSRGALKNRLYQQGVKGHRQKELLDLFANKALILKAGSTSLRKKYGHAVAKALSRNVSVFWVAGDEFGGYTAPGLSSLFALARSTNFAFPVVAAVTAPGMRPAIAMET